MASTLLLSATLVSAATAQDVPSCLDNDAQLVALSNDPSSNCVDAVSQNAAVCDVSQIYDICCLSCCQITDVYADENLQYWNETYIPYDSTDAIVPDACGYAFDDPNRKHLHIAMPSTSSDSVPAPVLFWAHGNGGTAAQGISTILLPGVAGTDYAIVGWESITAISGVNSTQQCQADFELVMDWVVAHGEDYNLSTEDWIVGGRSRGSICSWVGANSDRPAIKGMYLYGALPLEDEESWENGEIVGEVTTDSPPAYFAYGPCCPKPIEYEGEDKCVLDDGDIHNPRNGQRIVDRYTELGMEDNITLTDCMVINGSQPLHYFVPFVETLDGGGAGGEPTGSPTADDEDPTSSPTTDDQDPTSSVGTVRLSLVILSLLCCYIV